MAHHKNVLLMIADDMGKNMTCYGARNPKTPHLDALAATGTRFDRAFTSTASCSCSRSVIYTGLHTHENGQWGLAGGKQHFQCYEHIQTLPQLFNEAGYLTGLIGKLHVGPDAIFPYGVKHETNRRGEEPTSRDTALVADKAAAFFRQARDESKPFALTIGFIDPHRHSHQRAGFGNRDGYDERIKDVIYNPADVELPTWISDVPEARTELAEFYRSINRVDQGVGLILQYLKDERLDENTLVIFLSDNGPPFVNSKTTLYDAGVCLPLVIRAPGQTPGIGNPNLVSYIDLLPTMLDWAGQSSKINEGKRIGRSVLPILESTSEHSDWDHVFGSHTLHEVTNYWPTRFLRTRKYKYHKNLKPELQFPFAADLYVSLTWEGIRNSSKDGDQIMLGARPLRAYLHRPAEELYDIGNDPNEVNNLASNPDYRDTLIQLRTQLEKWQLKTGDPFLLRDGVSLTVVKSYVDAGERLDFPDRLTMDPKHPGTTDVPLIKWTKDATGISSGFWSSD